MPMTALASRFLAIAREETAILTLQRHDVIPDGDYGFVEFYCDEEDCDCRRVVIHVVSPGPPMPVLATIGYGWENPDYYRKWMGDPSLADDACDAYLDPFGDQSAFAPELLDVFLDVVADGTYVQRLKRHYALFKPEAAGRYQTKARKQPPRKTKPHKR